MKADANSLHLKGGPDAVRAMSDQAQTIKSLADVTGTNGRAPFPRFTLTTFAQIKSASTAEYLVKDIIPLTGLVLIYGPPKCGKSFWTFDLAMHVARGVTYRGKRVRGGTVVYLAAEGGQGFKKRAEAYRREHGCKEADFHLCTVRPDLAADAPAIIADIREQLGDKNPAMVVVDTVNRTLVGSENRPDDMARYLRAAAAIEDAFRCCVVLVHHCGVEQGRPRGHTSLTAAADVQIVISRNSAGHVVAEVELMKDGPSGEQFISRLKPVVICKDPDDEEVTSCVIEAVDIVEVKATPREPKLKGNQKTMFTMLHEAGKAGLTTEAWNEKARAAGIGVARRADLIDIRAALKGKQMVREFADRWTVDHRSG